MNRHAWDVLFATLTIRSAGPRERFHGSVTLVWWLQECIGIHAQLAHGTPVWMRKDEPPERELPPSAQNKTNPLLSGARYTGSAANETLY